MGKIIESQQMNLQTFKTVFGIDEETARRWVHSKGFPAYKQGGRWYVDIPEYYKWRQKEHVASYKYACIGNDSTAIEPAPMRVVK